MLAGAAAAAPCCLVVRAFQDSVRPSAYIEALRMRGANAAILYLCSPGLCAREGVCGMGMGMGSGLL